MKRTIQFLIVTTAIFAAAALAFSWNGHRTGGGGHHMNDSGYHMMGNMGRIDLSESEIKDLQKKRAEVMNKTRDLRKKAFNTRLAIEEEMTSGNTDVKKVEKLQNDLAEVHNKIRDIHSQYGNMNRPVNGHHMGQRADFNRHGYCW
jgi:peptidoglycan hydrolase CwlO-like protein